MQSDDQNSARRLPQNTVQAVGQAATDVIGGLRQSPTILAIVVLNIAGIAGAIWFLNKLMDRARTNMEVVTSQMTKEGQANRDLVEQCFVLARENQKDLRELREREIRELRHSPQ